MARCCLLLPTSLSLGVALTGLAFVATAPRLIFLAAHRQPSLGSTHASARRVEILGPPQLLTMTTCGRWPTLAPDHLQRAICVGALRRPMAPDTRFTGVLDPVNHHHPFMATVISLLPTNPTFFTIELL